MKVWDTDVLPKWEQRLNKNKQFILDKVNMSEDELKEVMETLHKYRIID